jgi:sporulation protein YlmC with PRC-barrel domain
MADTEQFTIGAEASCSDGTRGSVTRVIVDPVAEAITHLVVEPGHRKAQARIVPLSLVDVTDGQVKIRCARAEFDKLDPAEEIRFLPGANDYPGYGAGQVGYWPHYGLGGGPMSGAEITQTIAYDAVPPGEVDVRRGDPVQATDGDIGRVHGLVIDRASGHVTHVLLQEGHLWGRKEVTIPISAVTSTGDGIQLSLSKQQVKDLPPVDVDK